jgi:hypothetical protein
MYSAEPRQVIAWIVWLRLLEVFDAVLVDLLRSQSWTVYL